MSTRRRTLVRMYIIGMSTLVFGLAFFGSDFPRELRDDLMSLTYQPKSADALAVQTALPEQIDDTVAQEWVPLYLPSHEDIRTITGTLQNQYLIPSSLENSHYARAASYTVYADHTEFKAPLFGTTEGWEDWDLPLESHQEILQDTLFAATMSASSVDDCQAANLDIQSSLTLGKDDLTLDYSNLPRESAPYFVKRIGETIPILGGQRGDLVPNLEHPFWEALNEESRTQVLSFINNEKMSLEDAYTMCEVCRDPLSPQTPEKKDKCPTPVPDSPGSPAGPQVTGSMGTPTPTPNVCRISIPASWVRYQVKSGDTLDKIAETRGRTKSQIATPNCLTSVRLGQWIWVPAE